MKSIFLVLIITISLFLKLYSQQKPELKVAIGHADMLVSASLSPDGKYLVSSGDETVKIWDRATGKEIKTIRSANPDDQFGKVCFSSDSKTFLYSTNEIFLYDIEKGEIIKQFTGNNGLVTSLSFSNDGNTILSSSFDEEVKIWDVQTGLELKRFVGHTQWVSSACFSSDEKYILSGSGDKTVKLWDVKSATEIRTFSGHNGVVTGVAFSPDAKTAYSVSDDTCLIYWDVNTGNMLAKVHVPCWQISSIALSPDGKTALLGSLDEDIVVFDLQTQTVTDRLYGHGGPVDHLVYAEQGKTIISCSWDNCIKLWDTETKVEIQSFFGANDAIYSISFSPDGKSLLIGSNITGLKLWDLGAGGSVSGFNLYNNPVVSACFSPDGITALSCGFNQDLVLWDIAARDTLAVLNGHNSSIIDVCFSSDGKKAISCDYDTALIVWDMENRELYLKLKGGDSWINDISLNKQGTIAAAATGYSVFVWDIKTGKNLRVIRVGDDEIQNEIQHVEISPDGKTIACISFGNVYLCDLLSGIVQHSYSLQSLSLETVIFTADCKTILVAGRDNFIYQIDIATGEIIRKFSGHTSSVYCLSLSPDGNLLASGSNDNTIRLWDMKTGNELLTLWSELPETWVASTPDGRFDGSRTGTETLYFTKGSEIIPLESLYEIYYTPNLIERILSGEQFASPDINFEDLNPKPLVKIISPNSSNRSVLFDAGILTSEQSIEVEVEVTDQGGGIDEILLYHNGKLLKTTNRGFKPVFNQNEKVLITYSITLTNGDNKIKASAFNSQRTESIPDEITVNYTGTEPVKPNLYMLVIGINEYKNTKYNLNYAFADAQGFKKQIEDGSSGIFGNVISVFLSNADANKQRIQEELLNFEKQINPEDVFVFYYAGHGVMSEEDKAQFYLGLCDVTQMYGNNLLLKEKALSAEELRQVSIDIKAQKQLFIIDACQSGGIVDILASRGAAEEKAIAQLARSTGTYWLMASNTEQFAGEFAELGHGLFTWCILQGLSGKADAQNDKKITVQELSSYINDQVPLLSKQYKGSEQYPNIFGYGQDFPIVLIIEK